MATRPGTPHLAETRLGREQLETGYALKQLSQAGVRVFSYLDDREVLLDTAIDNSSCPR
jgi:hypothetical protein